MNKKRLEKATIPAGCFWCREAIFKRLKGARPVFSGCSGGIGKSPSCGQIYSEETGRTEVVQIEFDPKVNSFEKILNAFLGHP